ncbi:MAG: hypothetical protein PVJ86_07915 [Phycisphaerales bacterium]|jgi:hypothetical protein
MKMRILLTTLFLLSAGGVARAEDEELGITLDLQYRSKWLSKGTEVYGQQGAFFKTIDLDLYGTGFGVKVTHRNATASGYVDKQRFDYRPYFKSMLFEGQPYVTNYNISAGYEHYPGLARNISNTTWEWILALSWPNIMPEGLVPGYIAHYEYAAGGNYTKPSGADMPSGWVHRFILGYDLETPQTPAPIHLSSELAYRDGLGGAAHDWSHATFGASTKFEIAENLAFVPGVYHQVSMDDSVNKRKDVTYCILSMKYKF